MKIQYITMSFQFTSQIKRQKHYTVTLQTCTFVPRVKFKFTCRHLNTKLRENEILVYMYLINTKLIQTFYIEDERLNFRFVKNGVIRIKFLLYFSLRKKSRRTICLSSSRVHYQSTVLYNLDMHKKHLLKSCTLILCVEGFSYI